METDTTINLVDRRVGRRIASWARYSGAKQSDLAKAAGMDPASLSRAINGHRHWKLDELERITSYFHVTMADLFAPGDGPGLQDLRVSRWIDAHVDHLADVIPIAA